MWNRPRFDLKVRLTLRVAAISAACFAAISAYFLITADRAAHARIDSIAAIVAKSLELQQGKVQWVAAPRADFPNLDPVAAYVMTPGLCLAVRGTDGDMLQRFCSGVPPATPPPQAFTAFYRSLFDPGREAARPVIVRGAKLGDAVVWLDPTVQTAEAWHEAGRLMLALAIALPLLCVLVYAALARALRPTHMIRTGLERVAAGDLTARLPPFDLAELSAIRDVFNHLAESLDTALAERNELTRKLIALQDEERRHLARELHDEFGQSLAAIRALASSARQTAAQDCPALLGECDGIARTATGMMETLRGALFRLRPPDVEELGLVASLEGLVAGWNGRSRGETRFAIRFDGTFETLPATISANLYRIVQEALTNAAKHAGATKVSLELTMRPEEIALAIDDDGRSADPAGKSGMGLLGMRERVAALRGRLSFEPGPNGGSALRVVIPLAAADRPVLEHAA
ncbi:sensor histidine kinase [Bradyrhizobium arachidis]|uniref:Histidine kinase n=1 Tax=Bradyrhizobium arachidis TaxID=858423 RepID=A0AAE7NQW4_9BRAD|nr:HAMP domain-containing sensor histidine kinase [Bradyrhizobium arachidis]QOZ69987.1 histidine kinase [Bradyrhizobium arachidis]SFV12456.1 Histidine kinase-, DNA gyrase B-, and HSP90-like ATPase [Bradyrhizobium arachidis]